jgi:large subunit ribosomal protein L14e
METGRICMKTAGRDAGKLCVILEIKENKALIDGETRKRWINKTHLEPTTKTAEVQTGEREEVKKIFKDLGMELTDRKPKKTEKQAKKTRGTEKTKRVTTKEPTSPAQDQQQA